ncbi:MAG TPA: serine hydrolase, partial [Rheinheimera sp.]|nr:serine hydrolase [Rheinheimera sp.]
MFALQTKNAFLLICLLFACSASAAETAYRHANETIGTVREVYDGKLYPDIQVNTFRNIDRLFPSRTVKRGSTVLELPLSKTPLQQFSYEVDGKQYDLYDVLSMNRVSGMLVLHHGEI